MKYKVGDKIRLKGTDSAGTVIDIIIRNQLLIILSDGSKIVEWPENVVLIEEETKPKDMGEVSDGYHTFNELYEYRMLYNAALFNEFAKQGLYDVHKSRKHSNGEYPFGDSNWFIVMAELPTGQISNHYEMKDWDKFQIPEKPLANKWDEHSPKDVAERLTSFTNPKKEYPKTYEECCNVLSLGEDGRLYTKGYKASLIQNFQKLIICRNAYWKIAGDWEEKRKKKVTHYVIYSTLLGEVVKDIMPNCIANYLLDFPTKEMRDAFKENFDPDIEICKELL